MTVKELKDLGMILPNSTYKKKVHFVIVECPICMKGFKTRLSTVKNGATTKCRSCSATLCKTTHNKSKTKLYKKWIRMKTRCYNKHALDYQYYGAKGVVVCKEWRNNFQAFEKWSKRNGYLIGLSIDRINPDGDYNPENCRYITLSKNISRSASRENYMRRPYIKVTIDDASEVCEAYDTGLFTYKEIGDTMSVKASTIGSIIRGALV